MKNLFKKKAIIACTGAFVASVTAVAAENHVVQSGSVQPVPITITSDQKHNFPTSKLNAGEVKISQDEAEAMLEVMKLLDETNKNIEAVDDPLSGLSPDQRAMIEAMQEIIPMTPEQIKMFKNKYYNSQKASNQNPYPDAAPVSRSVDLSLTPGEALPVIRMRAGNVSTITFSDQLGNPWPILSVTSGDTGSFAAQAAGEQGKTNILVVSPVRDWGHSNMVVTLKGHPVPILLTLDSRAQEVVDFRTDIRLAATNPEMHSEILSSYSVPAPAGDRTMIAFLDGTPPLEAEKKNTSNRSVQTYIYQDKMYVRTMGSVLSPAYTAKSKSVSGLNVYVMEQSPIVLISMGGVLETVAIN